MTKSKTDLSVGDKVLIDFTVICPMLPRFLEGEIVAIAYTYGSKITKVKAKYIYKVEHFFRADETIIVEKWIDYCWVLIVEYKNEN